jgi:hypothetical protein
VIITKVDENHSKVQLIMNYCLKFILSLFLLYSISESMSKWWMLIQEHPGAISKWGSILWLKKLFFDKDQISFLSLLKCSGKSIPLTTINSLYLYSLSSKHLLMVTWLCWWDILLLSSVSMDNGNWALKVFRNLAFSRGTTIVGWQIFNCEPFALFRFLFPYFT